MSSHTEKQFGFTTRQLHAAYKPDAATGARAIPLYQTIGYQFRDTEHAANLFALKELGNIYTRLMNPTTDILEKRVADLEGGAAGLAASSGTAAQIQTIFTLANAGDHIVASSHLYGGTYNQFAYTLPKLGIQVTFVDPSCPENFEKAIRPNTKMIYGEVLGNPDMAVFPIEEVVAIANQHKVVLVIDNTLATPYLFRPLEWGAHIVTHSTTKFMDGHGTSLGGLIVDGHAFDYASGRFDNFTTPDPSYHGLVYHDLAAAGLPPFIIKARVHVLRDVGAAQSPFNSWQTLLGLETLSLRMARHVQNAQAVAEYLASHAKVTWVTYPGLKSHPDHERAKRYLPKGPGSILGFGIQGGAEAGKQFIEALQLFSHLANFGDTKSLAIHPASTTHSQLNPEQQKATGLSPDFIRLSIGIEDIDDILWDIGQALSIL